MGNRTTRKPGRRVDTSQRPSTFFRIALGVGVLLLIWLVVLAVTRPMTPPQKTPATATSQTSS